MAEIRVEMALIIGRFCACRRLEKIQIGKVRSKPAVKKLM